MTRPLYDSAEVLIYDPVPANSNATHAALQAIGFKNIRPVGSVDELRTALSVGSPDLLLCEVAGSESELCSFIQSVRQGAVAKNPFVVVVATTWRRDGTVVNQVLNSGADDLLGRPFASTLLVDRIRAQIERRKDFVVTADYIGPDRRRDASRSGPECIAVPNSLRIRTMSGLAPHQADTLIATEIKRACDRIDAEKMRRNAFQLCVQWRMLEQRRPGGHDFSDVLTRMKALSEDIGRRAASTPHSHAMQWCDSVANSIRAIEAMAAAAKADDALLDLGPPMHLLGQAALSLGRSFAPGEIHAAQLVELDAIVSRISVANANKLHSEALPVLQAS